MEPQRTYVIPYRGLKTGVHPFVFEIGATFFEAFPESRIHQAAVRVNLDFGREERMMQLDFRLEGTVEVPCDRCDQPMEVRISGQERLIVKFGETYDEPSEEVIIIPETSYQFDVAPFIYEYLHLMIPMRNVHDENGEGPGGCDPAVIAKLEEMNRKTDTDPRWDALRKVTPGTPDNKP